MENSTDCSTNTLWIYGKIASRFIVPTLVNSTFLNHLQSACNREITYNCFVLTPVCSIRIATGGGIEIEVYFPTLAIIHTYCPFTCFPHSLEARFRLYPAARVAPRRRLPQLVVGK